jgi:hypothetical protein
LRGQAEVRADRDLTLDQETDRVQLVARAFELDHAGAGLQEACRCIQRTLRRSIGLERQVRQQQRSRQAARHATGVIGDVFDRHRQRRTVSLHHHAQ